MIGLASNQQRLVGYRGSQSDDFCSLFALVGPTDLPFFSSPVGCYLLIFKRGMSEDRTDFFWIVSVVLWNYRIGLDELHV